MTRFSAEELALPYVDISSYLMAKGNQNKMNYVSLVKKAVQDTKNQVIVYKNELITPLFFASSAGATRNSTDLWDYAPPYLKSVCSEHDIEAPNYLKISQFTCSDLIDLLNTAFKNHTLVASDYDYQVYDHLPITEESFLDDVHITKRDASGYVLTIQLGKVNVSGESFANALSLNSSCFSIESFDSNIRIITNGSGHGLGFSQYGANVLAKSDYDYMELLKYYYSDVQIKELK